VPTYILTEDDSFYYVKRFDYEKDILLAILAEMSDNTARLG